MYLFSGLVFFYFSVTISEGFSKIRQERVEVFLVGEDQDHEAH